MPGMRTSMITTSGLRRSASSIALAPSEASPTTRMCGARESESRSPSRTTSWSSTIRVVISSGTRPRFYCGRRTTPGSSEVERELLRARAAARAGRGGGRGCRAARASSRTRVRTGSRRPAAGTRARRRGARTRAGARASRGARHSRKCSRVPGRRLSTFAQIPQAPASRAARTTAASCSGRSEIPGRIGAIPTEVRMPASTSRDERAQPLARRRGPRLGPPPDLRGRASAPRT